MADPRIRVARSYDPAPDRLAFMGLQSGKIVRSTPQCNYNPQSRPIVQKLDVTAMEAGDRASECQAQATALGRPCNFEAPITAERVLALFRRDPGPAIRDPKLDPIIEVGRSKAD